MKKKRDTKTKPNSNNTPKINVEIVKGKQYTAFHLLTLNKSNDNFKQQRSSYYSV